MSHPTLASRGWRKAHPMSVIRTIACDTSISKTLQNNPMGKSHVLSFSTSIPDSSSRIIVRSAHTTCCTLHPSKPERHGAEKGKYHDGVCTSMWTQFISGGVKTL